MSYRAGTTFRRDWVSSAYTTREKRKTQQKLQRRPQTVAVGGGRASEGDKVRPASWMERAKVYEDSYVEMKKKNKKAVKKTEHNRTPKAYNLEEHLDHRQGVVIIGQNGVVSNDGYYTKCMKKSKPDPSTGSDLDTSFLSSDEDDFKESTHEIVPLCWNQQLQDKDVVRICEATRTCGSDNKFDENSQKLSSSDHLVIEDEECGKAMELTSTVYIMLSWGKTCLLEWKDCLKARLHSTPDIDKHCSYLTTLLPSLTDLLDHTKEHDHSIEWRHIDTTLCVWLSWIHVNNSDEAGYNVFITDNGPVCTRAFRGIKARAGFGNAQLMHFNLVRDLPWVSTLLDIQGKQVNISIVCNNSPLHRGTELTMLSESIQLGTEFDENWCNPRTITDLVAHISSVEDLDEDRTDLLVISQLIPDLLKLSPSNSFQSPQILTSDVNKQSHVGQSDSVEDVEMTHTSSVWLQPATAPVDSGRTDTERKYLIGTEIALARTIHNYNKPRSPARKPNKKHQSKNTWSCPPVSASTNFLHKDDNSSQSHLLSSRPQSSSSQRKPSSKRLIKSRTLSALHTTNNTSTTKDLEMLTKSITKQLSIKNKSSSQQSTQTVIS